MYKRINLTKSKSVINKLTAYAHLSAQLNLFNNNLLSVYN
jgi:hypothetical protein